MTAVSTRRIVLDASATLAWVLRERGAETVSRLLPIAVMPSSAMVEVLYRAVERGHRLPAAALHDALLAMGVTVESVTDADTVRAAELIQTSRAARREHHDPCLSLGDGLCIAVAERLDLTITGADGLWSDVPMSVKFMPFC